MKGWLPHVRQRNAGNIPFRSLKGLGQKLYKFLEKSYNFWRTPLGVLRSGGARNLMVLWFFMVEVLVLMWQTLLFASAKVRHPFRLTTGSMYPRVTHRPITSVIAI